LHHYKSSGEEDSNLLQAAPSTPDVGTPRTPRTDQSDSGVLRLSHSQLAVWDRCRFLWKIRYVDHWKSTKTKPYLQVGKFVHTFLEKHYLHLMAPTLYPPLDLKAESQELFKSIQYSQDPESGVKSIRLAVFLTKKYIEEYSINADDGWRILAVEKHFEIPFVTSRENHFLLQGYIDLIIEWNERIWIVDHKTGERFWTTLAADMDSQMPTYAGALRSGLGADKFNVWGIMFNMIKTYDYKDLDAQPPEKIFQRIKTYRTPLELDNFMANMFEQVDFLYANKDQIYRNLSKDCEKCLFQEPCQMNLKGIPLVDALDGAGYELKEA
jgi:PD-(D/E)XK nuclease superfamily protein